eukprot:m.448914 g.448914  ORF g.448914 m.448914 type:complete len:139 (+) comp19735_c0_seq1:94-510(+)
MFEVSDTQKIGIGLIGFGLTFLFLGVLLFFDSVLLAMGNIMFIAGVSLLIGLQNAFYFFFQPARLKGSAFFFFGVILVLIKFAVIGMLVESVGLFFLFSGFIPKIILFMRSVPVVSAIFYLPFVDTIAQKLSGSTLPV